MSDKIEKYRPSNGTEGMIFEHNFCDRCENDKNLDCQIHDRAFCFNEDDQEYPNEWRYDENDQPTCAAFKAKS